MSAIGLNGSALEKVGLTVLAVAGIVVAAALLRAIANAVLGRRGRDRPRFWTAQIVHLLTAAAIVVVVVAIWFRESNQLAMVFGWVTAGVAIALQRVITSFAGYIIILRGNVFTIGDRITLGGVRGDVVALGFMQTTVMEMGQPASIQENAEPAMWVRGRQYTGRIVRVTNDRIFDAPVYNYTREFPFLWDEIHIPVRYQDDHGRVEQILIEVARRHTADIVAEAQPRLHDLREAFYLDERIEIEPKVFYRLTDNWLELALRFIAHDHSVRDLKDRMSREILRELDAAKIGIASATYDVVGLPTVTVRLDQARPS